MTENELELLHIIRTNENPGNAIKIALDLMIGFLVQHEVPPDTSFEHHQEPA